MVYNGFKKSGNEWDSEAGETNTAPAYYWRDVW